MPDGTQPQQRTRIRPGYWFVPRRFGLGATPVTWQGWALVLGSAGAIAALMTWQIDPTVKGVLVALLTFTLLYISWIKTDGGWGWHWGWRDGEDR